MHRLNLALRIGPVLRRFVDQSPKAIDRHYRIGRHLVPVRSLGVDS